jgi:hypothetical protein
MRVPEIRGVGNALPVEHGDVRVGALPDAPAVL